MNSLGRVVAVALLCVAVGPAQAELKDYFFNSRQLGAMGFVEENVEALKDAQTLVYLDKDAVTPVPRRRSCRIAVVHRDPPRTNVPTFIGVQILKMLRDHEFPGSVFVSRNEGWLSRQGKPLEEIRGREVAQSDPAQFATAHGSLHDLEKLKLVPDDSRLTDGWHAHSPRINADYSAHDAHLRFWKSSTWIPRAKEKAKPLFKDREPVLLLENRLIRFVLTDSRNPLRMPTFDFDCSDRLLEIAAVRIYLPFVPDIATTYLKFE